MNPLVTDVVEGVARLKWHRVGRVVRQEPKHESIRLFIVARGDVRDDSRNQKVPVGSIPK